MERYRGENGWGGKRWRGESGLLGIGPRWDFPYIGTWLFMLFVFSGLRGGRKWLLDFLGANLVLLIFAAVIFYEKNDPDEKRGYLSGFFAIEWLIAAVFTVAAIIHHNWPALLNP